VSGKAVLSFPRRGGTPLEQPPPDHAIEHLFDQSSREVAPVVTRVVSRDRSDGSDVGASAGASGERRDVGDEGWERFTASFAPRGIFGAPGIGEGAQRLQEDDQIGLLTRAEIRRAGTLPVAGV